MTAPPQPVTEEQLDWITEQVRREASKAALRAVKRWARRASAAFLVVIVAGGYGLHNGAETSHNKDAQIIDRIDHAIFGACRRVNSVRAQSNLSDFVSFKVLSASAQRRHRAQAQKLAVTALTNCQQAVKHPLTYEPPLPGPLGDPNTGKLSPGVVEVLKESTALVKKESKRP